jgi:hypothetical protein
MKIVVVQTPVTAPAFPGLPDGSARQDSRMSTPEPGLDLHEWMTRWEEMQEALEEDPEGALPELADLVESLLVERGFLSETGEPVTEETRDPEIIDRYRAGREIATLAEAGNADPGDVADAINNLREVYEFLIVERGTP